MYPYCSNTSIKNTTINTRETNNVIDLKQDQRLLQLLDIAQPQTKSTKTNSEAVRTEIEKTLLQEMEQTDFFRELLMLIPETELRDILYEIITDKQDHCIRLCFLFSKYQ